MQLSLLRAFRHRLHVGSERSQASFRARQGAHAGRRLVRREEFGDADDIIIEGRLVFVGVNYDMSVAWLGRHPGVGTERNIVNTTTTSSPHKARLGTLFFTMRQHHFISSHYQLFEPQSISNGSGMDWRAGSCRVGLLHGGRSSKIFSSTKEG